MNTQNVNFFNSYLNENPTLVAELQNSTDQKSFLDKYVNAANELFLKKGMAAITENDLKIAINNSHKLYQEEVNLFDMSTASAHTQASCTTSTTAGCTC